MGAATALEEYRLPRLAAVEEAYLVGKRRPLSELSPAKQLQIRQAYRDTDWASEYSNEVIGIYTDREAAIQAASIPGGYFHKLPVNASLPEETMRYKEHIFPVSDVPNQHDDFDFQIVAVPRHELERLSQQAREHTEELRAIAS